MRPAVPFPVLRNLNPGNTAKSKISYKGMIPLASQVPIRNKVCDGIFQIQTYKVIESVKYKFEGRLYMKYLYLHGLGQKPDSWNRVIKETKVSKSSVSLSLSDMLEGKSATYKELYSAFSSECDKVNDEIVLCGLSLGAVLALIYAIDLPD